VPPTNNTRHGAVGNSSGDGSSDRNGSADGVKGRAGDDMTLKLHA
jgi:hypothetical protein